MRQFEEQCSGVALATAAIVAAAPAYAQTPASEIEQSMSTLSCDADYFERFNPVTALDMVERLPGFTTFAGDSVRGLGGAAGDILIDGERPSAEGPVSF